MGLGEGMDPAGSETETMTQPRAFTVYRLTVSNDPSAKARQVVCYNRPELDRAIDRFAADRGVSGLAVNRQIVAEGRA